jgi:hypothetical protein
VGTRPGSHSLHGTDHTSTAADTLPTGPDPTSITTPDPSAAPAPFSTLNSDVLTLLVTYLPAPSAVCLSLTSKTNLSLVLETLFTQTLSSICPRDVRKPLPTAIQHNAYNVLMPKPHAYFADAGWKIVNSFIPASLVEELLARTDPERDRDVAFLQARFEALAYVRRLSWIKPEEIDGTDMMGWNLVRGHVPSGLLGSKAPSREFKGEFLFR